MTDAETTKVVKEFSDGWIEDNPELFAEAFLKFKEDYPEAEWHYSMKHWPNTSFLIAVRKGSRNTLGLGV